MKTDYGALKTGLIEENNVKNNKDFKRITRK